MCEVNVCVVQYMDIVCEINGKVLPEHCYSV